MSGLMRKNKIIDCITFFDNNYMFDLRYNILKDYVDYFIIVESNKTFVGNKKPYYLDEYKYLFNGFFDKIIYIKIDDNLDFETAWEREYYQRDCIANGFIRFDKEDIKNTFVGHPLLENKENVKIL